MGAKASGRLKRPAVDRSPASGGEEGKKMAGSQVPQRLTLATLDPRTLFPTQENIALVMACVQSVQVQLEHDRNLVRQYPENGSAREMRNESIQYLALLNDWISQARNAAPQQTRPKTAPRTTSSTQAALAVDQAEEGDFPVLASQHHPVELRRCLWDKARSFHYVQVKKIRDTIYGSMKLYQVGHGWRLHQIFHAR